MKSEARLQISMFLRLLVVCAFALLYAWGGMEMKWLRRFAAPAVLTAGMFAFSRDWRVFLQAPLLMLGLSMGYGADQFWIKVGRRLLFGAAGGASSITHLFDKGFNKRRFWTLFALGIVINPVIIATLGAINPVPARAEELLIGFMIGLWPMFIINDRAAA